MTVSPDFFKGLRVLEKNSGKLRSKSIIYCGDKKMTQQGVRLVPWNQTGKVFV